MSRQYLFKGLVVLLLVVLAGCAGHKAFQAGEQQMQEGRYEEAVALFAEAVEKDPANDEYRLNLMKARAKAAWEHLNRGRAALQSDQAETALAEFRRAKDLDPTLEIAEQEMKAAEQRVALKQLLVEASEFIKNNRLPQAKNLLNRALQIDPADRAAQALLDEVRQKRTMLGGFDLDVASDKPITLKFKDAKIQDVFNILTQLSGINFIFDEEIKTQKVTVFLENGSFAQALQLLLNMNNLGEKVLNSKTIIIYPRSRDKDKLYQDQIIQTFYLSNIDAKKAVNLLRTMLQLKKIYVHEELNALVIRDTAEVIKLCQQILEVSDRADSEVVFDVEVVEVSQGDILNFGPRLSTYSIGVGLGQNGKIVSDGLSPGTSTDNLVKGLSGLDVFYTLPTATFEFAKTLASAEILAQPKIRVKNKDKAKVHIGSREPVITVTTTNDTRSDNIQYIDVGVKLDIEPIIQLDDTVTTKVGLEVSSVSDRQTTSNGSVALTITTTNANSALTLKNGEQTILGGLLRNDSTNATRTFPVLSRLPLIGDIISHKIKDNRKREILLSITPHIVKSVDLPRPDIASIWSGGEDDLKAGPTFGAFAETFIPEPEKVVNPVVPGQQPQPPLRPRSMPVQPDDEAAAPAPAKSTMPIPAATEEAAAGMPAAAKPAMPPPAAPAASAGRAAAGSVIAIPMASPTGVAGELTAGVPPVVHKGEEFTLEVGTQNAGDLFSAAMIVHYDPGFLEFVGAEEGELLKQKGQETAFSANPDPAKGELMIGTKLLAGTEGVSGAGRLFRIRFKVILDEAESTSILLHSVNFQNASGASYTIPEGHVPVEIR